MAPKCKKGHCRLCGKAQCALNCERCGDFYCSVKCQRRDWPTHRYICFPMPRLVNETKANSSKRGRKIAKKKPQRGKSANRVVLTGFSSTYLVGIRFDNIEINDVVTNVTSQINEYGPKALPLKSIPKVNSYAIAKRTDHQFGRVEIINTKNSKRIWVQFCDYGTLGERKLSQLFEISKEICELPMHTRVVRLKDVKLLNVDFENLRRFENRNYYFKEYENHEIELFDCETGNKLNDAINKLEENCKQKQSEAALIEEVSTKVSTEETANAILEAPFKTVTFDINARNIEAVIIEFSVMEAGYLLFSCVKKEHTPLVSKVQEFLAKYDFTEKYYMPKVGEHCIADFEDQWYRAKVMNVIDESPICKVLFTDFLNQSILTSDKIRRYPEDLKIDCYTNPCIIHGLPKTLTPAQFQFLRDDVFECSIDRIISADSNGLLVECRQIVEAINNLQK